MNELADAIILWADERGIFDEPSMQAQMLKTIEEVGEVAAAVARGDRDGLRDGIGDVTVTLVLLAHMAGMTLEECLGAAYDEIKDRRGHMVDGIFIKAEDP